MNKILNYYQSKKRIILPVLGVLAVSLIGLIYVLLGEGSYVQVHDQVDGEILNYIYQAKYLFSGNVIPEFMNGMDKAAMTPPAPLAVLFYKILPPFGAYVAVQWLVVIVGFLGMYYLCKYSDIPEEIGFLVGILFAYMPFYPTYGLAALGQPMLVLSFLLFIKGKRTWLPLAGMVFYALMSSLTLVGFVWIGLGAIYCIYLFVRREKILGKRGILAVLVLTVTYILTNLDLLRSLSGQGFTTHRSEMALSATENLLQKFVELLLEGGSYSKTYSLPILCVALYILYIKAVRRWKKEDARVYKTEYLLVGIVVLICLAVLWNCGPVVEVRKAIGGMVTYFQADRVYWIFPFLWMLLLAFVLNEIRITMGRYKDIPIKIIFICVATTLVLFEGGMIFRDSTMNKNIRLLLLNSYKQVTWESIYMEDVFAEIETHLEGDKSSYSVVSLGMYPSIALYNGFTCADGYSNNYDVEYKHAFRDIMSPELEKDEEIRSYFDQWGNRCYLATAQRGYDMAVEKGSDFRYEKPAYDFYSMENLNIRYIFAAAPVEDPEYEQMLVEGSPFSSESSYYEVWVYDIKKK